MNHKATNARQETFSQRLLAWYDQQGRQGLPWREEITPYRVWISEIMLQQTQVTTVIPYFNRFINRFLEVTQLAKAEMDEVLHLWTGLGYYSRGRNLHRAANLVVREHDGKLPNSLEELTALPGIGRSTAGAILSIGFNQRAPILDGNVKRVLSRFEEIDGWPGKAAVLNRFWEASESYTPHQRVDDYTQAIMDLGATLCRRTQPNCGECPLSHDCKAYHAGSIDQLPTKKPKRILPIRKSRFVIWRQNNRLLFEKRPPVGLWGGLWSFPECPEETALKDWMAEELGATLTHDTELPSFRHTFSHFHLDITPILVEAKPLQGRIMDSSRQVWYNLAEPQAIGLTKPVVKLLKQQELFYDENDSLPKTQ